MRLIFTTLLIIFFYSAFSQRAIIKGTISTQTGSQAGFVQYSAQDETPQEFLFSLSEKGPFSAVQKISKVELENGTQYDLRTIVLSTLPNEYLSRRKEFYKPGDTLEKFVQLIVKGPVNLYRFVDGYGYPHFYYTEKESAVLNLLIYRPYLNNSNQFIEDVAFKNQINSLFRLRCGKEQNLQGLSYSVTPMMAKFKELNSCLGEKSEDVFTKSTKKNTEFGVLAGLSTGRIKNGGWYPAFGLNISFVPQYNKKSSLFGIDLRCSFMKSVAGEIIYSNGPQAVYNKVTTFLLRPFYRGYFGMGKAMPFFEAGLALPVGGTSKTEFSLFTQNENPIIGAALIPEISLGADLNKVSFQLNLGYMLNKRPTWEMGLSTRLTVN